MESRARTKPESQSKNAGDLDVLGKRARRHAGPRAVWFSHLAAEGGRIRRPDPSAARTMGIYGTRRSLGKPASLRKPLYLVTLMWKCIVPVECFALQFKGGYDHRRLLWI